MENVFLTSSLLVQTKPYRSPTRDRAEGRPELHRAIVSDIACFFDVNLKKHGMKMTVDALSRMRIVRGCTWTL